MGKKEDAFRKRLEKAIRDVIAEMNLSTVNLYGKADKDDLKATEVDPHELKLGMEVEMEHTVDRKVAKQIALDHLTEIPDYYTRLLKMEEDAGIKD